MTEAVVTRRTEEDLAEADVLTCPDDEQSSMLRSANKDVPRPTNLELQHPVRWRIDLREESADHCSIVVPDLVILPSASGWKHRASVRMHSKRPVHDTDCAQASAREPRLLGRPSQGGLGRRGVVQADNDLRVVHVRSDIYQPARRGRPEGRRSAAGSSSSAARRIGVDPWRSINQPSPRTTTAAAR